MFLAALLSLPMPVMLALAALFLLLAVLARVLFGMHRPVVVVRAADRAAPDAQA